MNSEIAEAKQQIWLMKGLLSEEPKEVQDLVNDFISGLHSYIRDYQRETDISPDAAGIALAIFCAEAIVKVQQE